jgi:hypothetical protein
MNISELTETTPYAKSVILSEAKDLAYSHGGFSLRAVCWEVGVTHVFLGGSSLR